MGRTITQLPRTRWEMECLSSLKLTLQCHCDIVRPSESNPVVDLVKIESRGAVGEEIEFGRRNEGLSPRRRDSDRTTALTFQGSCTLALLNLPPWNIHGGLLFHDNLGLNKGDLWLSLDWDDKGLLKNPC